MRLIVLLLLLTNVGFFAWFGVYAPPIQSRPHIPVLPPEIPRLVLLSEQDITNQSVASLGEEQERQSLSSIISLPDLAQFRPLTMTKQLLSKLLRSRPQTMSTAQQVETILGDDTQSNLGQEMKVAMTVTEVTPSSQQVAAKFKMEPNEQGAIPPVSPREETQKTAEDTVLSSNTALHRSTETAEQINRVCWRSGPYNQKGLAQQARARLRKAQIQAQLIIDKKQRQSSTWVYLPPYPTRGDAEFVEDMLTRQGIDDHYIVMRDELTNAISLGLYRNHEGAQSRLSQLRAKGYYNVQAQIRYEDYPVFWVQFRAPTNLLTGTSAPQNILRELQVQQSTCMKIAIPPKIP